MTDYNRIIEKYYTPGSDAYNLVMTHSRQVAEYAMEIIDRKHLDVDRDLVYGAAMLHDIGVFLTHAPSIFCFGDQPYLMHGILGAELLRKEGPEYEPYARVCETHIGVGLTADEIIDQKLPLPAADYLPETLEEKLVCYSDNFFSKSKIAPARTVETVKRQMTAYGQGSVDRLNKMIEIFE